MVVPSVVTRQSEIQAVVSAVERELAPEVVRIRYEITTDWSGDWAIFFRIVLRDAATQGRRLRQITTKVREEINSRLTPLNLGVLIYFNFRSLKEQEELREEAWA